MCLNVKKTRTTVVASIREKGRVRAVVQESFWLDSFRADEEGGEKAAAGQGGIPEPTRETDFRKKEGGRFANLEENSFLFTIFFTF